MLNCLATPTGLIFWPIALGPSTRLIPVNSPLAEEEDIDVAQERQRVYGGRADNDLLRVCDLTKVVPLSVLVVPMKVYKYNLVFPTLLLMWKKSSSHFKESLFFFLFEY